MKQNNRIFLGLCLSAMLSTGTCASFANAVPNSAPLPEDSPATTEPSTPPPTPEPKPIEPPREVIVVAPSAVTPNLRGLTRIEEVNQLVTDKKGKKRFKKTKYWVYKQKDGSEVAFKEKLKGVKDLRTQSQIHPFANRWRDRLLFWAPFGDWFLAQLARFGGAMVGAAN